MSETKRDLIRAAQEKKPGDVAKYFETLMKPRIEKMIDRKKEEVVNQLFKIF